MKKIILVLLTIASTQAMALQPRDGYYVCGRVTDASLKTQCITLVSNSYIDPMAAAACDRIESAEVTVRCMRTIANRVYDPRAAEACDSIKTTEATISCLATAGYQQAPIDRTIPGQPDLRNWVRESARYGLDQLNRGNVQEVRRLLEQMTRL